MFQKVSKNKKWTQKLISLMLVLAIFSSIHLSILAKTNSNCWVVKKDNSNQTYLQHTSTGEKILAAKSYDAFGNLEDFDLVEYANLLNNQPVMEQSTYLTAKNKDTSANISLPVTIHDYTESRNYTSIGSANISYGNQISTTDTFSASITLGWKQKNAIEKGATFGWSSSSSANFGVSFSVPKDKTGYITFRPRYNTTEGTLRITTCYSGQVISDKSYEVKGHSPKVLATGFTDGIFALKIK